VSYRLLFVCTANVCRSPLMEFTFSSCLDDVDRWSIDSRGTNVTRQSSMCSRGRSLITVPRVSHLADRHLSAAVTAADLKAADLVVTASREERSNLARVLPSSRPYTFTLREALALGEANSRVESSQKIDVASLLAGYAAILNSRRGSVVPPRSPRFLWGERVNPMDTPDVHHSRPYRHSAVLERVRDDTQMLQQRIATFIRQRS